MIYLYVFIFCLLLVFIENMQGSQKYLLPIRWGFLGFLLLFIGFRMAGPDYYSYSAIFLSTEDYVETVEYFFILTMNWAHKIKLPYNYYLFIIAVLSISIRYCVIQKYSPYICLSFYLSIVFIGDMGQIRAALAGATCWLAVPYCEERKITKFAIVILIASLMHTSALIFAVVYFLTPLRIKFPYMVLIWFICYLASWFLDNTMVGEWVDTFAKDTLIDTKMEYYSSDDGQFTGRVAYSIVGNIFKLLTLAVIYYGDINNDRLKSVFVNCYFFGVCLFFVFGFSEIMSARLSGYFISLEIIFIPMVLYFIKDKLTYWMLLSAFLIRAFYQFYVLIYIKGVELYFPYRNFLF